MANGKQPKFKCRVVCASCGGDKFKLVYANVASSKESFVMVGTMCHRGMGWDLSWFKPTCADCGHSTPNFDVTEMTKTVNKKDAP